MYKVKKYLIAGGGKCGLHFVNKYLDNFKIDKQFNQLKEIKNFADIDFKNYENEIFIVQKSFVSKLDIQENIPKFLDEGFEIIHIDRFPPQQYLAWFYTLFSNFVNYPKNTYKKNRFNRHFVKWCFDHLEASLELKNYSSYNIEIENFTQNFDIRQNLLEKINNKKINITDENEQTFFISKSNLGTSKKIIEIGFDRYPNTFNNFEYNHFGTNFINGSKSVRYLEEYNKIQPVDFYGTEFWENRIIFYHNIFFSKNKNTNKGLKGLYLNLLKNISIFKKLFYKKFINQNFLFD